MGALKQVYQAKDMSEAKQELVAFLKGFGKKYPKLLDKLSEDDPSLFSFYVMDEAIRRSVYTTNLLEGFHKQLETSNQEKRAVPQ